MFRSLALLVLLTLLAFVFTHDVNANYASKWGDPCPTDTPLLTKRNCGPSQVMNIMFQVYKSGKNGFNGLNDVGIACDQGATVNSDNALLCKGKLPFGASKMLSFSGTKNVGDMFADTELLSEYNKYVEMRTFKGFNDKFMEWKPTIDQWFPTCDASEKILVAGHSLGGAIAHIAGLYLAGKNCTVEIITAGEPASFLKPLSALAESTPHYRFVTYASEKYMFLLIHSRDPIAFLSQPFEYVHPSHSIEIPLQKSDDRKGHVNYSNRAPNGPFDGMSVWIHYSCNYQTGVDNTLCINDSPTACIGSSC